MSLNACMNSNFVREGLHEVRKSEKQDIEKIVSISIRAFETDVGGAVLFLSEDEENCILGEFL